MFHCLGNCCCFFLCVTSSRSTYESKKRPLVRSHLWRPVLQHQEKQHPTNSILNRLKSKPEQLTYMAQGAAPWLCLLLGSTDNETCVLGQSDSCLLAFIREVPLETSEEESGLSSFGEMVPTLGSIY